MDFTVVPLETAGVDERPDAARAAAGRRRAGLDHRRHQRRAPAAGGFVDDDRRDGGAIRARRVGLAPRVGAGHAERCCGARSATVGALLVAAAIADAGRRLYESECAQAQRSQARWDGRRARARSRRARWRSRSACCRWCTRGSGIGAIGHGDAGAGRHVPMAPAVRRLQLAVAIIVLSTAALLFRSADALARVNPGFVAEGVSVFELMLPDSRYGSPARRIEFQRRLLERGRRRSRRAGCGRRGLPAVRRRHLDRQHDDRASGRRGRDGEAARGPARR